MGLSYAALGETQNAVDAFAQAVKLGPSGVEPEIKKLAAKMYYNLGASQAATRRYGAAVEAFKEAITRHHPPARNPVALQPCG